MTTQTVEVSRVPRFKTAKEHASDILAGKYTLAQLRCEVPPSDELLECMQTIGLNRYEKLIMKLSN